MPGNFSDPALFVVSVICSLLFSLGGYFLLFRYFRQEKDIQKKNFLGLVILFNAISFFALIPVASHITMRYYIILFFVPFILLGLWGKFLLEHLKKEDQSLAWLIWGALIAANLFVVIQAAMPYSQGTVNSVDLSILGETQLMSNYVQSGMTQGKVAYITGEKFYVKRYFPALKYLANRSNLELLELNNNNSDQKIETQQNIIFYIANTGATNYQVGDALDNCVIGGFHKFNSITIFDLKNCQK